MQAMTLAFSLYVAKDTAPN